MLFKFKNTYIKKLAIFIICIEFLFSFKTYLRLNEGEFETYYSQYLCSLLILNDEKNCLNEVFNNYDFFYYITDIRKNINLSINIKKASLIENIIIIIGIIPFLKNNSVLRYDIGISEANKIFTKIFKSKKIKNGIIFIDFSDFETIKTEFNNLINYIWELIPKKYILDNLRYIISNYYDDSCLDIFEKSLNKNYEYFIKKYQNNEKINNYKKQLISK